MANERAYQNVQRRIEKALERSGRKSNSVEIVAVTKTLPAEEIINTYKLGIRNVGENRVQEADAKFVELPELPGLKKRLIGHLQSNKLERAIRIFDTIDSIHSIELATKLSKWCTSEKTEKETLLQVNTARDATKSGFDPDDIDHMIESINLPGLFVKGLMTIGELTDDESKTRKAFADLRILLEKINKHAPSGKQLFHLSMGMSKDFEIAIEEGATLVRLGTVLFGEREK